MKVIFSGLESSGKSLRLAMLCVDLVYRNAKWAKITGRARPIWSNMAFSEKFQSFAQEQGVELRYWKDLDDLVKLDEADIICDEVGNYFDSRGWENLSLDCRRWLTQGAKTGIEFYGGAQDFAQVDKAFRRLVSDGDLKLIRKIAGSRRPAKTKPPVKRIWGVCFIQSLDPAGYKEDEKQPTGGVLDYFLPTSYFLIRKKFCEIFDTNQKLLLSDLPVLKHQVRFCEKHGDKGGDGSCNFCKVTHV